MGRWLVEKAGGHKSGLVYVFEPENHFSMCTVPLSSDTYIVEHVKLTNVIFHRKILRAHFAFLISVPSFVITVEKLPSRMPLCRFLCSRDLPFSF